MGALPAVAQQVEVLSRAAPGSPSTTANGSSYSFGSMSADGRFTVFPSNARNLILGQIDANAFTTDVFLFDRVTKTLTLVNHVSGEPARAGAGTTSDVIKITADGRYIVFSSSAANLVTGVSDTNFGSDVFLFDRVTGSMTLV